MSSCNFARVRGVPGLTITAIINKCCGSLEEYWDGTDWGGTPTDLATTESALVPAGAGEAGVSTYGITVPAVDSGDGDCTVDVLFRDDGGEIVGRQNYNFNRTLEADFVFLKTQLAALQTDIDSILSSVGGGGPPEAVVDWSGFFSDQGLAYGSIEQGSPARELLAAFYNSDSCQDSDVKSWMRQVADTILKRNGCEAESSCSGDEHDGRNLLGAVSLLTNRYEVFPSKDGSRIVHIRSFCDDSKYVGLPFVIRDSTTSKTYGTSCQKPQYYSASDPSDPCC